MDGAQRGVVEQHARITVGDRRARCRWPACVRVLKSLGHIVARAKPSPESTVLITQEPHLTGALQRVVEESNTRIVHVTRTVVDNESVAPPFLVSVAQSAGSVSLSHDRHIGVAHGGTAVKIRASYQEVGTTA
eukprot:3447287-Prymnesium_polylepis.2